MKTKRNPKHLTLILSSLLALSLTIFATGCGTRDDTQTASSLATTSAAASTSEVAEESRTFVFTVIDADGNETTFDIETDKEMVGDALLEQGLIEGEEGPYGLYVKKVNGITADYDVNGTYWAFYINGEYAISGIATTPIKEGETYTFKAE